MKREKRREHHAQSGITGLETAIVLIAFVMVASVFAYVVLSAGLYSSQKAKEAVMGGLEETRGSVDLRGNVLVSMEGDEVHTIIFYLGQVSGGEAVDFTDTTDGENKVVISYQDTSTHIPQVDWTLTKVSTVNDDNMLDENEIFLITVDLTTAEGITLPGPYSNFSVEVKPPIGAVLSIQRTLPARSSGIVNLH